jgi:transposase-like protein
MNLFSLAKTFPTEDAAVEYWIATRWPDGVRCVGCDHDTVYRIRTSGKTGKPSLIFECGKCQLHFSPTAGTLFHDSHLPLQKWFAAIALMCEGKKGISANQMKRHLGVTYKTAWFMCHRIRKAMSDDSPDPLGSEGQVIEIDESFIGGTTQRSGSTEAKRRKVKVLGIAERGGRVHLSKIKDLKMATIKPVLDATLSPNASAICTDGSTRYVNMIPKEKHNRSDVLSPGHKGPPPKKPSIAADFVTALGEASRQRDAAVQQLNVQRARNQRYLADLQIFLNQRSAASR